MGADEEQAGARSLVAFRRRCDEARPHCALVPDTGGNPVTPADAYRRGVQVALPERQGWAKAKLEPTLHDEDLSRPI